MAGSGNKGAKARAIAALDVGRAEEAVRFAREAIAIDPRDAHAFCVLASALIHRQQYSDAVVAAEQSLAIDPDCEWAHALRAEALSETGQIDEALAAIDAALRLGPDTASHHLIRAQILQKMGELNKATAAADKALELEPFSADAHNLVGHFFFAAKHWHQAEKEWRASLAIYPLSAFTVNNLGASLDQQGRKEEAREAYRRAIRMDPTLGVSKKNLHTNVGSDLGKAGAIAAGGIGIGGLLKVAFIGSQGARLAHMGTSSSLPASNPDSTGLFVALALIITVVVCSLVLRGMKKRETEKREKQWEVADPALMALYRQIDKDIAAGRVKS